MTRAEQIAAEFWDRVHKPGTFAGLSQMSKDVLTGFMDAALAAQEGERGGANRDALAEVIYDGWSLNYGSEGRLREMALVAADGLLAAGLVGERGGVEVSAAVEAVLTGWRETDPLVRAVRAALADPAGALAKHDAETLDEVERRIESRLGITSRALRVVRDYRAGRIEAQP